MTKKRKRPAPSQAEIWDDTALVRSWNEAVEEYEFYHSIAARGEDVEDVLRRAEREEEEEEEEEEGEGVDRADVEDGENGEGMKDDEVEMEDGEMEDGEVEDGEVEQSEVRAGDLRNGMIGPQLPQASQKTVAGPTEERQDRAEEDVLHAPTGQDQVLENIKMAYWWAGYYSGLHDGQQKATQEKP